MKKIKVLAAFFLALSLGFGPVMAQTEPSQSKTKTTVKKGADKTTNTAKEGGKAVGHGAEEVGEGAVKGTKKAGKTVEKGAKKGVDKTKDVLK